MADKFGSPTQGSGEECEDWLTTYADAITLLMAFFVMMFSISKVDPVKLEQLQQTLAKDIAKKDVLQPIQLLKDDLKETAQSLGAEEIMGVATDERGIVLEFAAQAFYQPGTADIKPEAEAVLKRVAALLNAERYQGFQMEVEGHTDDIPIATAQFPSNWELSAMRATTVVRYFIGGGVAQARLRATGFADVSPKVPNRDMNGNPLPANQAINRRVTVHIMPRLNNTTMAPK
ncbi:MAG: flagellar motor protein MotB [Alphaproteobacteria bacterium]|nr:flagellar motor protein MotB [Alphaproteobacteria bacterium]